MAVMLKRDAAAVRLRGLMDRYKDHATFQQVVAPAARSATLRLERDTAENQLRQQGDLTGQGVMNAMKGMRAKHREELARLRDQHLKRAQHIAAPLAPKVPDVPADEVNRLIAWWGTLNAGKRCEALGRAAAGKDDQLAAAVLTHARYFDSTDAMRALVARRFQKSDPEVEEILQGAHLVDQILEDDLKELVE